MRQQLGRPGGVQRRALLQIFARKIDLPRLEGFVETNLPQLHLFDTKEHRERPESPGRTIIIIASRKGRFERRRFRRFPPLDSRNSSAPTTPSTCSAERMPTMAAVTAGWRSVQAMATSPAVRPWRAPMRRISSASSRLRESCGSWKAGARRRKSSFGKPATRSLVMLPGQQARFHRRIHDHADAVLRAIGQDCLFHLGRNAE